MLILHYLVFCHSCLRLSKAFWQLAYTLLILNQVSCHQDGQDFDPHQLELEDPFSLVCPAEILLKVVLECL